jgi:copper chaperone CopZ
MKTTYKIQNLKCEGCAGTISKSLYQLVSIKNIDVNVPESAVTVECEDEIDLNIIGKTLSKIGYPIEGDDNPLTSKAKSYVSCAIGKLNTN